MEEKQGIAPGAAPASGWEALARRRRAVLLLLIAVPSLGAGLVMHSLLPLKSGVVMNTLLTLLFTTLFAWVAVGFWSALAGLVITLRRYDRFSITDGSSDDDATPPTARTALLFPVYNEETRKVAEEIRTVWHSLKQLGAEKLFDVFILSDSTNPDAWAREEEAWYALVREENAEEHFFYRHRKLNRKGKSGNIADFCRKWGSRYPYMIVFDADSLMSGDTLVRLVRAMERRPDIGIIQTAPRSINSRTLIARIQQFSNHLYGPVFAAGLHYWQLGDAQYWGHNAIIRIKPFMEHCHLPRLPGRAPLGGHILSHDFVEAALMRRAGYGVWLAYDLDGSWEENPPSLVDELIRDRRWCQGNLQHSRLLFTRGFFPTHRALFINGIMSYGSALLWFLFLLASSCQAVLELVMVPNYFPEGFSLFPDWPRYFSERAIGLLGGTAVLLFLPKAFTVLVVMMRGGARGFGGILGISASAAGEVLVSALLAPVRMLFHSFFVITTLLGFTVRWNTQNRDDDGTSWSQAIRFHWWGALTGAVWGALIWLINPGFFLWLSPIVAGLVLSIPLSVWTSRASAGLRAMRWGLFLTPADVTPPAEVATLTGRMAQPERESYFHSSMEEGFIRVVSIPLLYSLHMTLLGEGARRRGGSPEVRPLVERALAGGPESLNANEKRRILLDPAGLTDLHTRVWLLAGHKARAWGIR